MHSVRGLSMLATAMYLCACSGGVADPIPPVERPPAGQDGANYSVVNAQITQAVQNTAGTLPLVAGSAAVVNVMIARSRDITDSDLPVVLRLYRNGVLFRSDTMRSVGPLSRSTTIAQPTVQFLIPDSLVTSGLGWQVEIDPARSIYDSSRTDNVAPKAGPAAPEIVALTPLRIRFVPIRLTSNNDATGNVTADNVETYLRLVRQVLPVGRVIASVSEPFSTSTSFGPAPQGGDNNGFWAAVLNEIDIAKSFSTDPSVHYYGLVRVPSGYSNITGYGLTMLGVTPSDFRGGVRTAVSVDISGPASESYAIDVIAHELGHNFGRPHARGCNERAPLDTLYPNRGGIIDYVGHDVWSWASGRKSSAGSIGVSSYDLMSYCYPSWWISAYNYDAIFAWRRATPPPLVARLGRVPAVVVTGRIAADGAVTLGPALAGDAVLPDAAADGDVTVQLRTAEGAPLLTTQVLSVAYDHIPGARRFLAVLPEAVGAAQIVATTNRGRVAVRNAVPGATTISARTLPNGEQEIRAASGGPLLVRDAVTQDVLGIGWNGRVVVRHAGPMTASVSNGVQSVRRDVVLR
jgi:hypothetical protein